MNMLHIAARFFIIVHSSSIMFTRFLLYLIFSFTVSSLFAQAESLNAKFKVNNPKIEYKSLYEPQGTGGILLEWQYTLSCSGNSNMVTTPIQVSILQKGKLVYSDTTQMMVFRCGSQQKAQYFIPYRLIDLIDGQQYEPNSLQLVVVAPEYLYWQTDSLKFKQPYRCRMDFEISSGSIKTKMQDWDNEEYGEAALPDPYYGIFLGKGVLPIAVSKVTSNSYALGKEKLSTFVLMSDSVHIKFFDEDGRKDELLASIAMPTCIGDANFKKYGEMQDNIKELSYELTYQQLTQQPIMLYAYASDYKGLKGVKIDIDYSVSRTYKDQLGKINFLFLDENKDPISISGIQAIEATYGGNIGPKIDSFSMLKQRERWTYFIPFYAWKPEVNMIAFYMMTSNSQKATATPCILLNPIKFSEPLQFANIKIEENLRLNNIAGIKLDINYKVSDDFNSLDGFYVQLTQDKEPLQGVYRLFNNGQQPLLLSELQESSRGKALRFSADNNPEKISLFVPYAMLAEEKFKLNAFVQSNINIDVIKDTTINVTIPMTGKDVKVNLANVSDFALQNDYGKVLQVAYQVPQFLSQQTKMHIRVKRNGEEFNKFKIVNCDTCLHQSLSIGKDTGALEIMLPYRHFQSRDSIQLEAWVTHKANAKRGISDTIVFKVRLPQNLGTLDYTLTPELMQIDQNALPTNGATETGWNLSIWLGSEQKINKALLPEKRYTKSILEQYKTSFSAHRRDKITIIVSKQDATSRQNILWRGDLNQMKNKKKLKVLVEKKFPMWKSKWILAPIKKK